MCVCVSKCYICVWVSIARRRYCGALGIEVIGICELPNVSAGREPNSDPLQEQQALLTAKLNLPSQQHPSSVRLPGFPLRSQGLGILLCLHYRDSRPSLSPQKKVDIHSTSWSHG